MVDLPSHSLIRGFVSPQDFLEQVIESVAEDTGSTGISLMSRLVFDCSDEAMLEGFTKTEDGIKVHPSFLPSSDTLIAWVCRLKDRHSPLSTFKLVIKCGTIETAAADIEYYNMVQFEYREATADAEDYRSPLIQEYMDLRQEQHEVDAHQFAYQLFPSDIEACYDHLVREAQEEALAAANMREALLPGNEAAVVGDGVHGVV
jgi:hypothetical protein